MTVNRRTYFVNIYYMCQERHFQAQSFVPGIFHYGQTYGRSDILPHTITSFNGVIKGLMSLLYTAGAMIIVTYQAGQLMNGVKYFRFSF